MSRYFFALWPDDEVYRQLEVLSILLPEGCGRKVRLENLHVTLVFLGSVEEPVMERIRPAVEGIRGLTFDLTLDRCGWWKRPQVIWLGSDTVPAPLGELVDRLHTIAAAHDVRIDSRPYAPHLTLVRKAKRRLPRLSFSPIRWEIRDFCLVQSITHEAGAEYRIVQNWPLT